MAVIDTSRLKRLFSDSGLSLSAAQLEAFSTYAGLLVEWNEKINLTAITDPEGIEVKHFLDSCLPLSILRLDAAIPQGGSLIDVGTGAGFPGIPMKLIRPDIKLTLLDSLAKRLGFLSEVCSSLGIEAELIHGRAEDLGRLELREKYDVAAARAVARLSVLCEYCLPLVKPGGSFLALKGSPAEADTEAEAAARGIGLLGGKISRVERYSLPGGDSRTLIVIDKLSHTPAKYQRPKGKMNKAPL